MSSAPAVPVATAIPTETGQRISLPAEFTSAAQAAGLALLTTGTYRPPEQMRWLVFGMPRAGKSTFAASNPTALVLDSEDKWADLESPRAIGLPARSGDTLMRLLGTEQRPGLLRQWSPRKRPDTPIKCIVLDTLDCFMEYVIDKSLEAELNAKHNASNIDIRDYGGREGQGRIGRGYYMRAERLCGFLAILTDLGYGYMLLAHMRKQPKALNDPSPETWTHAVEQSLYDPVHRLTDGSILVQRVVDVVSAKQTRSRVEMLCALNPDVRFHALGCNVRMPDKVTLEKGREWQCFEAAYIAANRK